MRGSLRERGGGRERGRDGGDGERVKDTAEMSFNSQSLILTM